MAEGRREEPLDTFLSPFPLSALWVFLQLIKVSPANFLNCFFGENTQRALVLIMAHLGAPGLSGSAAHFAPSRHHIQLITQPTATLRHEYYTELSRLLR